MHEKIAIPEQTRRRRHQIGHVPTSSQISIAQTRERLKRLSTS
jgi:hypothetical protein